ncbi:HalOD1 output domain-containing protein [Halorarum salinum]|uniref:Halobacterial output domain-containing protein n=1 Tax=Halorarum salinum TaxID=2743089 RepID=A0A7D5QC89_9EURY|nr:HalOD1 output domain-containing protein [Halobaculum salinum]QLG63597.1 hypothetical protein HUG12_18435 [Halobaculum salinum]
MRENAESDVVRRELERDGANPAVQVSEVIAELEGKEVDELEAIYDCIDHVLDRVFSDPPRPGADVEVAFSYEGYRVSVEQDGSATFVRNG